MRAGQNNGHFAPFAWRATDPPAVTAAPSRRSSSCSRGIAALVGLTWPRSLAARGEMAMHEAMGMAMPSPAPWDLGDLGNHRPHVGRVMMVAMMLPSATPLLVLFARSQRSSGRFGRGLGADGLARRRILPRVARLSGLCCRTAVGAPRLAAAARPASRLHQRLGRRRAARPHRALIRSRHGKYARLTRCQSPLGFMLSHWREGRRGALRMGSAHGAYCVGCCWALMVLLFVGG